MQVQFACVSTAFSFVSGANLGNPRRKNVAVGAVSVIFESYVDEIYGYVE